MPVVKVDGEMTVELTTKSKQKCNFKRATSNHRVQGTQARGLRSKFQDGVKVESCKLKAPGNSVYICQHELLWLLQHPLQGNWQFQDLPGGACQRGVSNKPKECWSFAHNFHLLFHNIGVALQSYLNVTQNAGTPRTFMHLMGPVLTWWVCRFIVIPAITDIAIYSYFYNNYFYRGTVLSVPQPHFQPLHRGW